MRPRHPAARATTVAVLLCVAAIASGCRRRQPKPPPTVTKLTGESTLLPRVTTPAKEPSVRVSPERLSVRGKPRDYLVIEPTAPAAGPLPLVLVLHGDGGTMRNFHEGWPFERATQNDAYVVYLEGLNATWDLETLKDNRDIAYAEAVVSELAKRLPIDRTRVFATGYSSGGFFANVLACHRPDLLRAISSNAGGAPYNQPEKWGNGFPKCPGQKPVATLALHGAKDWTVGLDSGRFDAEYWAYVNGCSDSEMETSGYPECEMYRGCPSGKNVGFCTIGPLGHWVWSEAAIASWTFFQRQ